MQKAAIKDLDARAIQIPKEGRAPEYFLDWVGRDAHEWDVLYLDSIDPKCFNVRLSNTPEVVRECVDYVNGRIDEDHNIRATAAKELSKAAIIHAKKQLGEQQFKKNKDAALAIATDFNAGANYILNISRMEVVDDKD